MEILEWLQEWFNANCNGEWEHKFKIRIETVDNPGWMANIEIEETILEDKEFDEQDYELNEFDWKYNRIFDKILDKPINKKFMGVGDPNKLLEILLDFRKWAECYMDFEIVSHKNYGSTYALIFLQQWYLSQCDGDWEHCFVVKISTTSDPGWEVIIDLEYTELEFKEFKTYNSNEDKNNWKYLEVEDKKFYGKGDINKLVEILGDFHLWALS